MNIYLKAARIVADITSNKSGLSPYCCDVLRHLGMESEDQFVFRYYFRPIPLHLQYPQAAFWWGVTPTYESQMARSLALLFMHEMEKDL
jgi:hypothetical protein